MFLKSKYFLFLRSGRSGLTGEANISKVKIVSLGTVSPIEKHFF